MDTYLEHKTKGLFSIEPKLTKQMDFDSFWERTLEVTKAVPLNPTLKSYDYPSPYVKVYEITYNGFDDTTIYGWFVLPTFKSRSPFPCVITFHGYTGNRGFPAQMMQWAALGIASLNVDCRSQSGKTGNQAGYSSGNEQSVVTLGLLDKEEYYFRQVYMDGVKAIDFALSCKEVDPDRIIINGGSQGGAIAMAVCALDDRPYLCTADVPSNSHLVKRVEDHTGAFGFVTDYLKKHPLETDLVFHTLSYFDTMNMADRIQCPVLASVGLKDPVCPAENYYATYNRISSEKHIKVYPFNGHEGGGGYHNEYKLKFIMDRL